MSQVRILPGVLTSFRTKFTSVEAEQAWAHCEEIKLNSPGSAGILRRRDLRLALLVAALFSLVGVIASALAAVGGLIQKAGTALAASPMTAPPPRSAFLVPASTVRPSAARLRWRYLPTGRMPTPLQGLWAAVFDRNPDTGALIQKAGPQAASPRTAPPEPALLALGSMWQRM